MGGNFAFTNQDSLIADQLVYWDGVDWNANGLGNGNGDTSQYGNPNPTLTAVWFHDTLFISTLSSYWQYDPAMGHAAYLAADGWHPCGSPNSWLWFLEENGRLFSGGEATMISGDTMMGVTEWVDGALQPLPNAPFTNPVGVYDSEYWHGMYYFGGVMLVLGSRKIVAFDGVDQWQGLGGGVGGNFMRTIEGYGDSLYVGGYFPYGGADVLSQHIQLWDGTQWHPFFPDQVFFDGQVFELIVHDGALYVSGIHHHIGDTTHYPILRWDGEHLCSIGGANGFADLTNIVFFQDDLYASVAPWQLGLGWEFIARLEMDGLVPDTCVTVTTSVPEPTTSNLHLHYDPATVTLHLSTSEPLNLSTLELFDPLGRRVYSRQLNGERQVSVTVLAPGVYLALVRDARGDAAARRFVKH